MPSKSRQLSKLITGEGVIKTSLIDSDALGASASKSVVAASGTAVYSSADTLPTSASNGDQALVTSTNRLYVFTNNGWYNIALINSTPYWSSEASSSYDLNTDATVTTITLLAVDSEGIPITYTATTDSNFDNIATISKDSDNGRTFTIVPIDSDGSAAPSGGSGTVTFKASDGVNVVSTLSTFSIEFQITNSNYTTILLKADSDGTDNQVDASTIGRAITEGGNTTSTAFTPYHPGGYSVYFDGTDDRIEIASLNDLSQGSYTIEGWYYFTTDPNSSTQLLWSLNDENTTGYAQLMTNSGSTILRLQQRGGVAQTDGTFDFDINTWYHIATVWNGTNMNVFVNGVSALQSNTNVIQNAGNGFTLCGDGGGSYGFAGYVRDFRITKGTALYDSDMSVPTGPLTATDSETELLICHKPYIGDGSNNNYTLSVFGNTSTKRFGPYNYLSYNKTDYGGSIYSDGTGDYMTTPADTTHLTMAGDFTIDFWYYPTAAKSNGYVYGKWNNNTDSWAIFTTPNWSSGNFGYLTFYYGNYGSNESATNLRSNPIRLNAWHYCRITRESGVFYMSVNGKVGTRSNYGANGLSWSDTRTFNANAVMGITGQSSGYTLGQAYLADLRVIVGTALTTGDFTPPTAPVSAVTNTKLLTCTNKNDIWDTSFGARMVKGGNVTASSAEAKFATSSAVYFDGTSDYLDIYPASDLYALGSKDFTIDMWVNFTVASSDTSYRRLFMADDGGNIANNFQIIIDVGGVYGSTGSVMVWAQNGSNTNSDIRNNTVINDGNWHHVAVSRTSNTVRLFVDGVRQGTNLTSWTHGFTGAVVPRLGSDATTTSGNYQGYIQDFRLMVGKSLYTSDSNITVPTSTFKG